MLLCAHVNTHLSLSVSLSVLLHDCILSCTHTPPLLAFYDSNWVSGDVVGLVDVVQLHPLHFFPHKELISTSWLAYLTLLFTHIKAALRGCRGAIPPVVYFPERSSQCAGLRERARVSLQMPAS